MSKKTKVITTKPNLKQSQLTLMEAEATAYSTNKPNKKSTNKYTKKIKEPATPLMKAVASYAPSIAKMREDFTPNEIREINHIIAKREEAEISENAKSEDEIELRKKAIKVKRIAKKLESGNNSKLIFFPSYSKKTNELIWYKAGNFSALYYTYRVADRLGRIANLKKDTDHFAGMNHVVSLKNIESFAEEMMQLNDFESFEKTLDDIYIFYLKKPLEKEEVWILKRTQAHQKNLAGDIIRPKNADANFYQYLLMFIRELLPKINRLEKGYYESIGIRVNNRMVDMVRAYTEYAEGFMRVEDFLKIAQNFVLDTRMMLVIFNENDVWSADKIVMFGDLLHNFSGKLLKMKIDDVS